ncbi:NUDIX domain-containing protein [Clostridium sp. BL-8]|uniref:NUDIX hydrolase n=1 Tax=Clostridium sp. BL-8 TaxID=349938 RepID=UPI00098C470B|nr:NUDIX domain-containing protein [Clostridium sp. BL-8]OOM72715.1 isopentenyl-diphosphate delta-isomerase [Clostridium sp. BL-8]
MKELLTIYDENLKEIGSMSRDEIHKRGLKHKVVHCWIIEKEVNDVFIYFQQRSYSKSDFPGMYDIACAGHIDAGEEAENAMLRELKEEVGLKINKGDLKYIGRKFETFQKDCFKDDEICEMYLLEVNNSNIFILGEEVEDVVKVSLNEYRKWINGEIELLNSQSIIHEKNTKIQNENICPHIKEYNEQLFMSI